VKPKLFCKVCGKQLVRVTGMVCVDGHGRIKPVPDSVPSSPSRLDLPIATFSNTILNLRYISAYTIEGLPGGYQRWRRWITGKGRFRRAEETPGEIVKARYRGDSMKFVRIEEVK